MSDIPVTDKTKGEKVEDSKLASVPPAGAETQTPKQEAPAQGQQGQPGVPIQRGNVDILTLQLLAEIRDEIRLLRLLVQTGGQRPPQNAPVAGNEGQQPQA